MKRDDIHRLHSDVDAVQPRQFANQGGGIFNDNSILTLSNCLVTGNSESGVFNYGDNPRIGATLTMRILLRLQATSPGFDAEGVLTASVALPTTKYAKPEQRFAFYQRLLAMHKPKKLALTAGMHKLLTILNAMVKRQRVALVCIS